MKATMQHVSTHAATNNETFCESSKYQYFFFHETSNRTRLHIMKLTTFSKF